MYKNKADRIAKRMEKGGENQNSNWFSKLGYKAVITLPATSQDQLIKRVKENLQKANIKDILVTSDGGEQVCNSVVRSNPFPRENCGRECMVCVFQPSNGQCSKSGVCYEISCNRAPCRQLDENEEGHESERDLPPLAKYAGESSRTAYTRGTKHLQLYRGTMKQKTNSFMWRHCEETHEGIMGEEDGLRDFKMDVVEQYKDPLSRQLRESLEIVDLENRELGWRPEFGRKIVCMNSMMEYFQCEISRTVHSKGNLKEV